MMVGRRTAALAIVGVALAGCGTPTSGQPDTSTEARSLWSARSPYVGDNSRMVALVREVGPGPAGSYSIELQTARPPYGMTIALTRLDKPFDDTDLSEQATLLLGLVANLDKVSLTSGGHAYSLTSAGASKALGYDVKELGRDQGKLGAYLDLARD
jgi:uncharacterized protein DUF4825